MAMLGVPYDRAALDDAPGLARKQATEVAKRLAAQGGPPDMNDRDVIALTAYMQRLGADMAAAKEGAK